MGIFKRMKQSMVAAQSAELPPDVLAAMTPEQRRAYETHVLGRGSSAPPASVGAAMGAQTVEPAAVGRRVPDPPRFPDRARQAAHEAAEREAARASLLAPQRVPVQRTRIPTTVDDELGDVSEFLGSTGLSARADLVFGLYRVPDWIGRSFRLPGRRYAEWEILHAPSDRLPPAEPPGYVEFDARRCWIARNPGEPAVLDEDLAVGVLSAAGEGPQRCLGAARRLQMRPTGGEDAGAIASSVSGLVLFHTSAAVAASFDDLRRASPATSDPGGPAGVCAAVLDWAAIAAHVQPSTGAPFDVPSPAPHLPATAQELLCSYLGIVGVHPADTYSVQVTEHATRDLMAETRMRLGVKRSNRGAEEPCADGETRPRLRGGSVVVIVYLDRPEYAAGRQRWATYETHVLGINISLPPRPTLSAGTHHGFGEVMGRAVDAAERVADYLGPDSLLPEGPPHRYCSPERGQA